MATRWGFVSAGKIAHDFATSVATLPSEEHTIVAVAARDVCRAQAFAKLHNIPTVYKNYELLAQASGIDVVYIGTLNHQHYDVAKLMLNNGKNVLCEKPLTLNAKQSTELVELAKKKNLFLMEAIWSRCFPIYDWIAKEIESGSIGEVKQVLAAFGFPMGDVPRMIQRELGGGTILDLGVYTLQFASFVFKGETPTSIKASGHLNHDGIDESMSAILTYKNGRTATIATHLLAQLPNEGFIIGTKGTIKIPNFWCPTEVIMPSGEVKTLKLPKAAHPLNFINSTGLAFEAAEVRRCLLAGLKQSPRVSHKESILLAQLEDELRKQLGVVFSVD